MNWFGLLFDARRAGDAELVRRLRAGDEACWRELYRRHHARLYRYALRMTGTEAAAGDITQETFVAFLELADRYDAARAPLGAWLLGIARNRVRKALASSAVWEPADEAGEPAARERDPLEAMTQAERLAAVRAAVAALPEAYREVVVLIEFEEMTYEETAAALGAPVGTVRSRLHRARALLQQSLAGRSVVR
ncbi:MAG: sigma-70 family RNA polymerase sigma factor [Bryobacterales bacterium]|nr:sigma-70 family RNA polymerase sigma factor [Bryobacterales bacterium]